MVALVIALLIILALFGGGFAWNLLWWIAIIALVLWVVGLFAHGPERRWYGW